MKLCIGIESKLNKTEFIEVEADMRYQNYVPIKKAKQIYDSIKRMNIQITELSVGSELINKKVNLCSGLFRNRRKRKWIWYHL